MSLNVRARFCVAVVVIGAGSGVVSAQENAAESDGAALFVANGCYQCHGYQGQGGAAPRIAPTLYPLQAFVALVRHPASEMPAYSPVVLSDAALEQIYAYVRSRPEPPPASDIPQLSAR
jgi:mono/diheme cytochrome c family protein